MINKLYHPGNQLSRRRQQNQEKLFVEWRRQKSSLRRNDGLRWKEHIAETKADEQRITSHPLSARLRAGRMLRNVCFRTHVIPSANSNFDPARGFHSTTAPFCFEACAPTGRRTLTHASFFFFLNIEFRGLFKLVLIPKTIGNRKRDCAWGGSGW